MTERATYPPLDELKPVGENIWLIDGATVPFGPGPFKMPFPTRMTVIRLAGGGLLLHSPTPATDPAVDAVSALGPVRHIVSPNMIHHLFIADWAARFPDALTWASPGVRERSDARFDRDLGPEAPPDWAGEIDQILLGANRFLNEAVLFHRASRTAVLTDMIENFEPSKLPGPAARLMTRLGGVQAPKGATPRDIRLGSFGMRNAMRRDIQRLIDMRPEKLIVAHGAWWRSGAVDELVRAFAWTGPLRPPRAVAA